MSASRMKMQYEKRAFRKALEAASFGGQGFFLFVRETDNTLRVLIAKLVSNFLKKQFYRKVLVHRA